MSILSTAFLLHSPPQRSVEKLIVSMVSKRIAHSEFVTWVCYSERFSVLSSTFANKLYERLNPHLPESLPCPPSMKRRPPTDDLESSKPHSCNPNIRVYKYTPSQYFGYVVYQSLTLLALKLSTGHITMIRSVIL